MLFILPIIGLFHIFLDELPTLLFGRPFYRIKWDLFRPIPPVPYSQNLWDNNQSWGHTGWN